METLVALCHPFVNIKDRTRVVYYVAILLAPETRDWVRSTVHLQTRDWVRSTVSTNCIWRLLLTQTFSVESCSFLLQSN